MKNKGRLIVFSAPSGCGKGTMLAEILKDESFRCSVSATRVRISALILWAVFAGWRNLKSDAAKICALHSLCTLQVLRI